MNETVFEFIVRDTCPSSDSGTLGGVARPALRTCAVIADFSARCHLAPSADVCAGMCAPELQELRGVSHRAALRLRAAPLRCFTPHSSPARRGSLCWLAGVPGGPGPAVCYRVRGDELERCQGVRCAVWSQVALATPKVAAAERLSAHH